MAPLARGLLALKCGVLMGRRLSKDMGHQQRNWIQPGFGEVFLLKRKRFLLGFKWFKHLAHFELHTWRTEPTKVHEGN